VAAASPDGVVCARSHVVYGVVKFPFNAFPSKALATLYFIKNAAFLKNRPIICGSRTYMLRKLRASGVGMNVAVVLICGFIIGQFPLGPPANKKSNYRHRFSIYKHQNVSADTIFLSLIFIKLL
jgi:hypothetical protein